MSFPGRVREPGDPAGPTAGSACRGLATPGVAEEWPAWFGLHTTFLIRSSHDLALVSK